MMTEWCLIYTYVDVETGRMICFSPTENGPVLNPELVGDLEASDGEQASLQAHVSRKWKRNGVMPTCVSMGSVTVPIGEAPVPPQNEVEQETPMIDAVKKMFPNFEFSKFPSELCIHPNEHDKDVLDAKERFLCVSVDTRFPTALNIRQLIPYISPFQGRVYYGWTDPESSSWIDHFEKSIHQDNERVVAWKQILEEIEFINHWVDEQEE